MACGPPKLMNSCRADAHAGLVNRGNRHMFFRGAVFCQRLPGRYHAKAGGKPELRLRLRLAR
jgi:hypothetical protein